MNDKKKALKLKELLPISNEEIIEANMAYIKRTAKKGSTRPEAKKEVFDALVSRASQPRSTKKEKAKEDHVGYTAKSTR